VTEQPPERPTGIKGSIQVLAQQFSRAFAVGFLTSLAVVGVTLVLWVRVVRRLRHERALREGRPREGVIDIDFTEDLHPR